MSVEDAKDLVQLWEVYCLLYAGLTLLNMLHVHVQ
ncbi:hypothetical protein Bhyg_11796, partial [Pseudolycoriella hygida]